MLNYERGELRALLTEVEEKHCVVSYRHRSPATVSTRWFIACTPDSNPADEILRDIVAGRARAKATGTSQIMGTQIAITSSQGTHGAMKFGPGRSALTLAELLPAIEEWHQRFLDPLAAVVATDSVRERLAAAVDALENLVIEHGSLAHRADLTYKVEAVMAQYSTGDVLC